MKHFIIGFLAAFAFFYLVGVMMTGDFRPYTWPGSHKWVFVFVGIALSIGAGVELKNHYEEWEYEEETETPEHTMD